jgi:hypothetical protein
MLLSKPPRKTYFPSTFVLRAACGNVSYCSREMEENTLFRRYPTDLEI